MKNNKRIGTIKIGPIEFDLLAVKGLSTLDGEASSACIDYEACEIKIDRRLSPQAADQALWHEIVHGILTDSGRREHDEGMIDALAYGILAALKDNPRLAKTSKEPPD